MQKCLTEFEYVNEIRLVACNPKLSQILVEGEKDCNLFKKFKHYTANIIPAELIKKKNNKGLVINAIREINKDEIKKRRVIAIIDSDFNLITSKKRTDIQNLFYTDYHDIDTQVFYSQAFESYMEVFFNLNDLTIKELKTRCIEIASEFGYYLLALHDLECFDEIDNILKPIDEYISKDSTLQREMIERDIEKKKGSSFITQVKGIKDRRRKEGHQRLHLANGHDLFKILYKLIIERGIKKKGLHDRDPSRKTFYFEKLERGLRNAYDSMYFSVSTLYNSIIDYQKRLDVKFLTNFAELFTKNSG